MSLIYKPKGRAREYSPLALNIYNGCDHGCEYCYGKTSGRFDNCEAVARKDVVKLLDKQLQKEAPQEQVLLSFIGDPYCRAEEKNGLTREVIDLMACFKSPMAILTKGGKRCLRDIDLFSLINKGGVPIKVGASLTFILDEDSREWEPDAALPGDRMFALRKLHDAGIRTWVSLEPVIYPQQTLELIDATHEFVDEYKVGKWNHDWRADKIDWNAFGCDAVSALRFYEKAFYVKEDLRKLCEMELTAEECDMDFLTLKKQG